MSDTDIKDIAREIRERYQPPGEPIFVVQECVRVYGFDDDYREGESYLDPDGEPCDPDLDGGRAVGYCDRWEIVMICLTRTGAREFCDSNAGRYAGSLRVRVWSAYNCPEIKAIRAHFAKLPLEK